MIGLSAPTEKYETWYNVFQNLFGDRLSCVKPVELDGNLIQQTKVRLIFTENTDESSYLRFCFSNKPKKGIHLLTLEDVKDASFIINCPQALTRYPTVSLMLDFCSVERIEAIITINKRLNHWNGEIIQPLFISPEHLVEIYQLANKWDIPLPARYTKFFNKLKIGSARFEKKFHFVEQFGGVDKF